MGRRLDLRCGGSFKLVGRGIRRAGGRRRRRRGGVKDVVCEIPGHGMFWEADECARCLRDVSGDFFFSFSFSLSPSFLLYGFAHMFPPLFPPPVSEEKKKEGKQNR